MLIETDAAVGKVLFDYLMGEARLVVTPIALESRLNLRLIEQPTVFGLENRTNPLPSASRKAVRIIELVESGDYVVLDANRPIESPLAGTQP
jgi:hypothetical protein